MITQSTNLNLIPGRALPRINATQYDVSSRALTFAIYDGDQRFTLTSGTTARIQGRKPDGHAFDYAATVSTTNNVVTASITQQMTAAAGEVLCEIILQKNSERIGTLNFILAVQETPLNGQVPSDSDLADIITLATKQMNAAAASAQEAESWAKGTKGGTAVPSTDPAYNKHAKYYAEQAAGSANTASTKATNAANSATTSTNQALKSEGYATGTQNGTAVGSGSPYYHKNSKYYSEQADTSAQAAASSAARAESYSVNTPYIGANGNWYVWNTTTGAYVDTGVDASITVAIADITMLAPDQAPYVTNTGTSTDPVFHLFLPRGKGISNIAKTSTTGLTDFYTITYSDGATTSFSVTNGNGISGISKTSTSGLTDTYTISYTNGTSTTFKVKNGKGIGSIEKTGTSGLVDTYTITFNDGTTQTYTVTNGKTAYQAAVEGGYPGTEQDFNDALGNFESLSQSAYQSAYNASQSAAAAADSAQSAAGSFADAKAQADRAQAYADFIEPHFVIQNNRLYIKDDAVGEFITANNRLYIKLTA